MLSTSLLLQPYHLLLGGGGGGGFARVGWPECKLSLRGSTNGQMAKMNKHISYLT